MLLAVGSRCCASVAPSRAQGTCCAFTELRVSTVLLLLSALRENKAWKKTEALQLGLVRLKQQCCCPLVCTLLSAGFESLQVLRLFSAITGAANCPGSGACKQTQGFCSAASPEELSFKDNTWERQCPAGLGVPIGVQGLRGPLVGFLHLGTAGAPGVGQELPIGWGHPAPAAFLTSPGRSILAAVGSALCPPRVLTELLCSCCSSLLLCSLSRCRAERRQLHKPVCWDLTLH